MRVVAFIVLFILATLLPMPLFAMLVIVYALVWDGYELLLLAFCIDAFYGAEVSLPYYTISTILLLITLVWLKPRMLFYNLEA